MVDGILEKTSVRHHLMLAAMASLVKVGSFIQGDATPCTPPEDQNFHRSIGMQVSPFLEYVLVPVKMITALFHCLWSGCQVSSRGGAGWGRVEVCGW